VFQYFTHGNTVEKVGLANRFGVEQISQCEGRFPRSA
jgi:hypothetical protein